MSEKLCQNAFYEAMELRGEAGVCGRCLSEACTAEKYATLCGFSTGYQKNAAKKMRAQAERAQPRPLCIIYVYAVRSLAPMQMETLGLLIYAAAMALIL